MNRPSNHSPLISVVMPTYNSARWLEAAVRCIAAQTVDDWELIIIDDGSTDSSPQVLAGLAAGGGRLRIIRQENRGVGAALNAGLDLARGKYLARMDADDLTPPERFAEQITFLETHPEITVVGGWHRTFGAADERVWEFPTEPNHLKSAMLFRNPISHPTVMMRREPFGPAGYRYRTSREFPEDYDLWVTVAEHHALANIPKVLLSYRIGPAEAGTAARRHWPQRQVDIQCRLLARMGLTPTSRQREIHTALAFDELRAEPGFIADGHAWLLEILRHNRQTPALDERGLLRTLTGRYVALFRAAAGGGLDTRALTDSPFAAQVTVPLP